MTRKKKMGKRQNRKCRKSRKRFIGCWMKKVRSASMKFYKKQGIIIQNCSIFYWKLELFLMDLSANTEQLSEKNFIKLSLLTIMKWCMIDNCFTGQGIL